MVGTPRRTHTRRNKLQDTIEKMYEKIGLLMVEMQKTQRMVKAHCDQKAVATPTYEVKAPRPSSVIYPSPVPAPREEVVEEVREVIPRGRSDWHYFSANYAASNPDVPRNKEFSARIADEFQRWKDTHPGKSYADYRGSSNLPVRRRRMTKRAPKLLAAPVQRTLVRASPPKPLVAEAPLEEPLPVEEAPSPFAPAVAEEASVAEEAPVQPVEVPVAEEALVEAPVYEEAPVEAPVYEETPVEAPAQPAQPAYDEADLDQAPEEDEYASEEEVEDNTGLSTIRIGDSDYYLTTNQGLFRRGMDADGNPIMGDWVGYLEDDGATIRETSSPL